jgi:hypothetical protein
MDAVIDSACFSSRQIRYINICRLYLNVISISDITMANGTHLDMSLVKGTPSLLSSVSYFPACKQAKPGKHQWSLWKKACRLFGEKGGRLFVPLGNWLVARAKLRRDWKFFYNPRLDKLFYSNPAYTQSLRNTDGWKSFKLHEWETAIVSKHAVPVSVTITDEVVQVTKYHEQYKPPDPAPESFDFDD